MTDANLEQVDLTTRWFGLKIGGPNAILIVLFITMLLSMGYGMWENSNRRDEHIQLMCAIRLNLFMNSQPPGAKIDWLHMPVDLYPCIPKFLYERDAR